MPCPLILISSSLMLFGPSLYLDDDDDDDDDNDDDDDDSTLISLLL